MLVLALVISPSFEVSGEKAWIFHDFLIVTCNCLDIIPWRDGTLERALG